MCNRNKDGLITPWESFESFRALGYSLFWSVVAVMVIQAPLSFATTKMFPFDPLMRIDVSNIHRGKHGSDSGVYDCEGRFQVQKFETLFSSWDRNGKDGLTFDELWQMTADRRMMFDYFGWYERLNGISSSLGSRQSLSGSCYTCFALTRLRGLFQKKQFVASLTARFSMKWRNGSLRRRISVPNMFEPK